MSVAYHSTPVHHYESADWTAAVAAMLMEELADLIVTYTVCTVLTIESQTSTLYSAVLGLGDGMSAIRLTGGNDDGVTPSYKVERGRYANSTFVSLASDSATFGSTFDQQAHLATVNGGEVWCVWLHVSGASGAIYRRFSGMLVESSYDNVPMGVIYLSAGGSDSANYVWYGVGSYAVFYDSYGEPLSNAITGDLSNAFPNNIVLLMPTALISPRVGTDLGVPTIGGKTVYHISDSIPGGTEFYMNGRKYASLGTIAVLSD